MDLFNTSSQNCVSALMFCFVVTKHPREYKGSGVLLKQIEFLIHLLDPASHYSTHNVLFWLYALLETDIVRILSNPVLTLICLNVSMTCQSV